MKGMRVGQVTLNMGQGGIENLILSLARALRHRDINFSLCCLDGGGALLKEAELEGVPATIFNRREGLDWRLIASLAKAFRAQRLQVIHTHNEAAHFYGCIAARLAGVPVVINTEHSRHYIEGHWRRRLEKRVLSMWSDRIVPVSAELHRMSTDRDGVPREKLQLILNGVDIDRFDAVDKATAADFRLRNGIPPSVPVVCIVARLHPIKNHSLLLRALKEVVRDLPDIRLLVVGDGEERSALEQLTRDLGLGGGVTFLGNRSDVPVILKASNLLVLCSKTEGLPLVLLEAMATRVPIVVTKGANAAGLVLDDVSGVVADETVDGLGTSMKRLLGSPESAKKMAAAAYRVVQEGYSIARTATSYSQLYHDCLMQNGKGAR